MTPPVSPERRSQIESLYHAALAQEPESRAAFLLGACADDRELLRELESLLENSAQTGSLLVSPPRRIGDYELRGLLGVGGMGEVYRAHDARLHREVAIKVLPPDFAADPARVSRFEREARLLASLNHPNIATVHGIEWVGTAPALVMELVEGETLGERIQRMGGLPVDEVVDIARQIAAALDVAHERGIVHRDVKPANVKIGTGGLIKVLDFGLAKNSPGPNSLSGFQTREDLTGEGTVVGTVAYMSPEQARGQVVDKRTDIWAFGCVLYEMLTGRTAFVGETLTDVLAAVLDKEPNWDALPAGTPVPLRRLLRKCLQKRPDRRLRDIGDVIVDLDQDEPSGVAAASGARPTSRLWMLVAFGMIVVAAGLALLLWGRVPGTPVAVSNGGTMTRLTWDSGYTTQPAISRDGRLVAYATDRAEGNLDIWVQQVTGSPAIRLTTDTTDDSEPDIAPDGSVIAFHSERSPAGVYAVSTFGGDARLIAPNGHNPRFSPDGRTIAFWTGSSLVPRAEGNARHVFTVATDGGEPTEITTDLASIGDPVWSPDGAGLLVFGRLRTSGSDLGTDWWFIRPGQRTAVRSGVYDRLQSSGIDIRFVDDVPFASVWTREGVYFSARRRGSDARSLWRIALDPVTGQVTAPPVRISNGTTLDAAPAIAADGRMVFAAEARRTVLLGLPLDADAGKALGPPMPLREDTTPTARASLSADGRFLAFFASGLSNSELWIRDLSTSRERLLAVAPKVPLNPIVSADGQWVAYTVASALRGGGGGIGSGWVIPTSGGAAHKLCDECILSSWLPGDSELLMTRNDDREIDVLDRASGRIRVLVTATTIVDRPLRSPDGKWLSFNEEGRQIVVLRYPLTGPASATERQSYQTRSGAERTVGWSPDSRLLYVLLESDGFRCLYSLKVDPATGRLDGNPELVYHYHQARWRSMSTGNGSAVVPGTFLSNHQELSGNLWMTSEKATD